MKKVESGGHGKKKYNIILKLYIIFLSKKKVGMVFMVVVVEDHFLDHLSWMLVVGLIYWIPMVGLS